MPWFKLQRTHGTSYGGRLVRLNVGLEDIDDLIAGLGQALQRAGLAGA
ncbi:MAG: PLP-dependent transferase [Pyrinomonadaceae bacterium]|nr:PLP-dependent transferase [Pyrinomonadaceae bacterium]